MIITFSECDDEYVINRFKNEKFWGFELILNLHGCDKNIMRSESKIRYFIKELCNEIKMTRHGEPVIERFGHDNLYGYTFMQMIETSSIVGHFAEETGDIYLDIFSCKEFSPSNATRLCKTFFKANNEENILVLRNVEMR